MNKTISTPMALAIIMILAILIIGGVFAYQYWWIIGEKGISDLQEQKSVDKIAGWKTYTNQDNGLKRFEIKYPADAKLKDFDTPIGFFNINAEIYLKGESGPTEKKEIYITKENTSEEKCINPFLTEDVKNMKTNNVNIESTDFKKESWVEFNGGFDYYQGYKIYSKRGYYCYTLTFLIESVQTECDLFPCYNIEEESKIFNDIISTFKPFNI